jgi:hypothetical protein
VHKPQNFKNPAFPRSAARFWRPLSRASIFFITSVSVKKDFFNEKVFIALFHFSEIPIFAPLLFPVGFLILLSEKRSLPFIASLLFPVDYLIPLSEKSLRPFIALFHFSKIPVTAFFFF